MPNLDNLKSHLANLDRPRPTPPTDPLDLWVYNAPIHMIRKYFITYRYPLWGCELFERDIQVEKWTSIVAITNCPTKDEAVRIALGRV